jgi:hypothetical protein
MKEEIRQKIDSYGHLPALLTVQAVKDIIGKGSRTISRLLKNGRLEKMGRGRGTRIVLSSVLRYLEEERKRASEVAVVSAAIGASLAKGRQLLRRKQEEDKLKRALEMVNAGSGTATVDASLEACVFDGVCMSVVERDAMIADQEAARRARRLGFQSVRGI